MELADSFDFGLDVGWEAGNRRGRLWGLEASHSSKVLGHGGGAGFSYSQVLPRTSPSTGPRRRGTSTSASAFVAISTSDSPYIAGQPSDVIIGGGATCASSSPSRSRRNPRVMVSA